MKAVQKRCFPVVLMLAIALPVMGASPTAQADKVAQKMLDFDKALGEANAQIDGTLAAMNAMTTAAGPDLVKKYKEFGKAVTKLDDLANKTKARSAESAERRDEYLKQWEASQSTLQNEQLKAASEARRAELLPKIESIKAALGSAKETFVPFMQALKDLNAYFANNLTPGAMAGAADLVQKCNADAASVKTNIIKGQEAIKDLAASIQPGGVAKK